MTRDIYAAGFGLRGVPGQPGEDGQQGPTGPGADVTGAQIAAARDAAVAAKTAAESARAGAEAVGTTNDTVIAGRINTPGSATATALSNSFARRRMYDVRDFTGSDDMGAAINRAVTAAYNDGLAEFGRPGQVVLPKFNEAVTTVIVPKHGVDIIGSGWGKTVLRPQGKISAIKRLGPSGSDALRDVTFADFEIDGTEQTLAGGGYVTDIKGFYITRMVRVHWDHVYVHDTGATGFGNDFHFDCTYTDCLAERCGRLNNGTQGGGAGFGFGTGLWTVEALQATNCIARSNKTRGMFFETQSGVYPLGAQVTNLLTEKNGHLGFEDAGTRGLQLNQVTARLNGDSGIVLGQGTIPPGAPGYGARISKVLTYKNGIDGVLIDASGRRPGDGNGNTGVPGAIVGGFRSYEFTGEVTTTMVEEFASTITDIEASENGQHGIRIVMGESDVMGLDIIGANLHGNDECGLALLPSSTTSLKSCGVLYDATLAHVRATGNGRDTTAAVRDGIHLGSHTRALNLEGLRTSDRAATKTQSYGLSAAAATNHHQTLVDGHRLDAGTLGPTNLLGAFLTPTLGSGTGMPTTPGGVASPERKRGDTFNRPDTTNTVGSTDLGPDAPTPWTVLDAGTGAAFRILGGKVRPAAGTGNMVLVQDVGFAGGIHRIPLAVVPGVGSTSGGLAFRVQDATNFFYIPFQKSGAATLAYAIEKRVNGTRSIISGGDTSVVPVTGDAIRVEDDGTTIKLYVNGALIATGSDTQFATATKAGISGNFSVAGSNNEYDGWSYSRVPN